MTPADVASLRERLRERVGQIETRISNGCMFFTTHDVRSLIHGVDKASAALDAFQRETDAQAAMIAGLTRACEQLEADREANARLCEDLRAEVAQLRQERDAALGAENITRAFLRESERGEALGDAYIEQLQSQLTTAREALEMVKLSDELWSQAIVQAAQRSETDVSAFTRLLLAKVEAALSHHQPAGQAPAPPDQG